MRGCAVRSERRAIALLRVDRAPLVDRRTDIVDRDHTVLGLGTARGQDRSPPPPRRLRRSSSWGRPAPSRRPPARIRLQGADRDRPAVAEPIAGSSHARPCGGPVAERPRTRLGAENGSTSRGERRIDDRDAPGEALETPVGTTRNGRPRHEATDAPWPTASATQRSNTVSGATDLASDTVAEISDVSTDVVDGVEGTVNGIAGGQLP